MTIENESPEAEEKVPVTTPPSEPARVRGGCLTVFLIAIMVVNPIVAILYFTMGEAIRKGLPDAPSWAIPVLGVFCLLNLVFAIALWMWKKWGFYGFVASTVAALVINIISGLPLHQVVVGPIGVVILYALLRKVWDQLE
jgi:hypothetical protein